MFVCLCAFPFVFAGLARSDALVDGSSGVGRRFSSRAEPSCVALVSSLRGFNFLKCLGRSDVIIAHQPLRVVISFTIFFPFYLYCACLLSHDPSGSE